MDKKQSLEKSKKILNDQRGEQKGKNKEKKNGKNAVSRDNNNRLITTKENRHNLKNSKANKIADPIHKRTSYSQDHS